MATSKSKKTSDNGPQNEVNRQEQQRAETQDVVLEGDEAQDAVDKARQVSYAVPVSTTMKIGDRDKGPRTYAEAVEAGQVEEPKHVVVNPSTYEAAVAASQA